MSDPSPIRSTSNSALKRARAVLAGRERGTMALEGERLVEDALARGVPLELVLAAERRGERAAELERAGVPVRLVEDALFDSLSTLRTPSGLLALAPVPGERDAAELPAEPDALVVVAAGLQDPGNLGALARTAEAAGARALVVAGGGCRPWNGKALRGSMGSLLRLPVFERDAEDAWELLAATGFRPVLARTRGGLAPADFDWSGRVALWVTAESGALPEGLAQRLEEAAGVTIPMAGAVESLNATSAAAVLLFAAGRTAHAVEASQ